MININNLKIKCSEEFEIKSINTNIEQGEIVSIIGESGSGKSTLGKALVGDIDDNVEVEGEILIDGKNILKMNKKELKIVRNKKISISFQNSQNILNPSIKIKTHIYEIIENNDIEMIFDWLEMVGLERSILEKYPKQISGGERQKILILLSLINHPNYVVLDEPTNGLDKESRVKIADLIIKKNKENNISFIIITHDLGLVNMLNGRSMVMYDGHILEANSSKNLINNPRHPYTRGLINSSMDINIYKDIWGIKSGIRERTGCPFYNRCVQRINSCKEYKYELKQDSKDKNIFISCNRNGIVELMKCMNIKKSYKNNIVLDKINLEFNSGEFISIIGKSGIGKTTLLEAIGGFRNIDEGEILFNDKNIDYNSIYRKESGIQFIFQDSNSALNSNFTVEKAILEPVELSNIKGNRKELLEKVLKDVGLSSNKEFIKSKIRNLSGGEKQRVSIARALIMKPLLLLADEPMAMLDPSSKANLLRFMKGLQNIYGFTMVMITHDINAALKVSDRIYKLDSIGIKEYSGINMESLVKETQFI